MALRITGKGRESPQSNAVPGGWPGYFPLILNWDQLANQRIRVTQDFIRIHYLTGLNNPQATNFMQSILRLIPETWRKKNESSLSEDSFIQGFKLFPLIIF